MKDIIHVFGPGETIKGIIRKYNRHKVPPKIMERLSTRFNELNDTNVVPRVGDKYKIPVYYDGTEEEYTEEEILEIPTPAVEPKIEPEPEPIIEPEPELDSKTDAIVELTQEVLASIVIEEEEQEMPKPKNSSTAMLDRQRRRELARGETPKEHVLTKVENVEETPEVVEQKTSKFKADPVGRKKRKPVNPKKKKKPQVEEKEVDLEKEKEKEEISKMLEGKASSTKPRHHRDLRKRRRG